MTFFTQLNNYSPLREQDVIVVNIFEFCINILVSSLAPYDMISFVMLFHKIKLNVSVFYNFDVFYIYFNQSKMQSVCFLILSNFYTCYNSTPIM